MPTVDIFDLDNQVVGSLELADAVFAADVNEALLYEAVRQYTASQRAGTHNTKRRGEVAGSGKKLWKQKGTGRARMGSIRSPLWRHGGTVHGPVPRSYAYKLPRKMILGALRSALSAKLRDGELKVVDKFSFTDHKTKTVQAALGRIEVKAAVEKLFKVEVAEVRTCNFEGKERRRGRFTGFRPDWKKAYVKLKAGEKAPDWAEI